jgi:NADH:ubiquinone oxidoreductase subunit E
MSFSLFGGPPRVPTHSQLPMPRLIELGTRLAGRCPGGEFTVDDAAAVAEAAGCPVSHVYAAAPVVGVCAAGAASVRFVVCTGGCQGYGSLDRVGQLLELRRGRAGAGKADFDVQPIGCLDSCNQGAVIRVHSPGGVALMTRADADKVERAVAQLMDE